MAEKRKPGPKPNMGADERRARNARIMALFIAGNSDAEIARIPSIGLTTRRVNQVVKQELKNAASYRQLLTDQALAIYVTRLETLIKSVWPDVVQREDAPRRLKAVETARRLLDQQAQLYELEEGRIPIPPMNEQEYGEEDDDTDELSQYRRRHRG